MDSTITNKFKEYKAWDYNRESMQGEHWLALGAALALLFMANRSSSTTTRVIGVALGSAMLLRAASGRDGIVKLLPYVPMINNVMR